MFSVQSLIEDYKPTYGGYYVPNPMDAQQELERLRCDDLPNLNNFELWAERKRIEEALVNGDTGKPHWLFTGQRYIKTVEWLQARMMEIDKEHARRRGVV